jgi:hypothetical protein
VTTASHSLIVCAELSLTVPIVNTLAFLFTVIGEWFVDKKVIARGEFLEITWFNSLCSVSIVLAKRIVDGRLRYLDWHGDVHRWYSIVCSQQDRVTSLIYTEGIAADIRGSLHALFVSKS